MWGGGEERGYRSGLASRTGLTKQPAFCLALTLTQRAPCSAPDAVAWGRSGHGGHRDADGDPTSASLPAWDRQTQSFSESKLLRTDQKGPRGRAEGPRQGGLQKGGSEAPGLLGR